MDCIKHLLAPHIEEISAAENTNATLVLTMFDILRQFLDDVVNMNFGGPNSQLVLLGGIMINCDGEGTDMFLPLSFERRTKDGKSEDLFKECFPNNQGR